VKQAQTPSPTDFADPLHQGHYRSILVGEIIGILADQDGDPEVNQSKRGGTRIDPLGARIQLDRAGRKAIADAQKEELSK